MRDIFRSVVTIALSMSSLVLLASVTLRAQRVEFLSKVELGEHRFRYYLLLGHDGTPLPLTAPSVIQSAVRPGDELSVRFYPTRLFSLEWIDASVLDETLDSSGIVMLYPAASGNDTLTVDEGYGFVTFATTERGLFHIRLTNDTSVQLSKLVPMKQLQPEVVAQGASKDEELTQRLKERGATSNWEVRRAALKYPRGDFYLEIVQQAGSVGAVIYRSPQPIKVGKMYDEVLCFHNVDASEGQSETMSHANTRPFYESIIPIDGPGVHNINVLVHYNSTSWEFKQAPFAPTPAKVSQDDISIVIAKERQLPNSLRARVGYAAFDKAGEGRLIANFVMILNPHTYFTEEAGFLSVRRFNPTTGLQIGGTGEKDVVFLLGLSYKLIAQADVVFGCRFGREGGGMGWKFPRNAYFGVTLDPGLFDLLSKQR